MTLDEILNYEVAHIGEVTISVYHLLKVVIILVLTAVATWFVRKFFNRQINHQKIDKGKGSSVFQIIKYLLWVLGISLALESVGFKLTFLLAGSAALLVGAGFGLQQTLNDFVSGVILLFEGTIQIGDVVEVDQIVGKVKHIGLRTSRIETRDNISMIIPNSSFVSNKVINWSDEQETTRFHIQVGVAYGSDVQKVTEVLLSCARDHKLVEDKPTPFVRFLDFGDSSLNFQLFFWTDQTFEVENTKSDLRYLIDARFRENQIQIPFPQRDLHLVSSNITTDLKPSENQQPTK